VNIPAEQDSGTEQSENHPHVCSCDYSCPPPAMEGNIEIQSIITYVVLNRPA